MATSGTVGTTTVPVDDILGHVWRRCGKTVGEITAEVADATRRNLFLFLSHLANHGVNLWAIERTLIGTVPYRSTYTLPAGTVDALNTNYRTLSRLSGGTAASSAGGTAGNAFDADTSTACTQTAPLGNISYILGTATSVTTVGYLPNASATLSLVFEFSTDAGTTWSTAYSTGSISAVAGTWLWYDLPVASVADGWRVRAASGTLDVRELYFGNTPTEVVMARLNRDDFAALPNKGNTGDPLQFWLDRKRTQPELNVWPVPTNNFGIIVSWRHRQVEDIGAYTNEVEVPQRWLEAIIWETAWRTALEIPGVDQYRLDYLQRLAKQFTFEAENEERDNSPVYYAPNISWWTA